MEAKTGLTQTPASSTLKSFALPDAWIERIFQRMEDRYGALWADRYGAFPRERVKRSWAEDLASFIDCPDCFRAALKDAIDECKFPPTLPEFVALCRKHYVRPQPKQAALPDIPPRYTSKEEGRRRLAELKAKFPSMKRVLDEVGAG